MGDFKWFFSSIIFWLIHIVFKFITDMYAVSQATCLKLTTRRFKLNMWDIYYQSLQKTKVKRNAQNQASSLCYYSIQSFPVCTVFMRSTYFSTNIFLYPWCRLSSIYQQLHFSYDFKKFSSHVCVMYCHPSSSAAYVGLLFCEEQDVCKPSRHLYHRAGFALIQRSNLSSKEFLCCLWCVYQDNYTNFIVINMFQDQA